MNNKKYIIITIVVFIVAGLIFFFVKNKKTKLTNTIPSQSQSNESSEIDRLKKEQQDLASDRALDAALEKVRLTDKDLDGLGDEEEKKIGTNLNNPDTDGDGLLDGDEIKFYKTNPLKPDTDNDGFKDGSEVRSGYSPIGSGKLKK
jgi:hypothetical protein